MLQIGLQKVGLKPYKYYISKKLIHLKNDEKLRFKFEFLKKYRKRKFNLKFLDIFCMRFTARADKG